MLLASLGTGAASETDASARFTGKPYDADLDAFVFPFRNDNPETGTWLTADAAGFPDGPNQHFYAPVPTTGPDPLGLESYTYYAAVHIDYEYPTEPSVAGIAVTVASQVGGLASNGMVSSVLSAVSGVSSNFMVNQGDAVVRGTTYIGGDWLGGPPPSGEEYVGLSVSFTVNAPVSTTVFWPTTDTSGEDFHAPYEDGDYTAALENNGNLHPDEWHDVSGGLAYPGSNGSISTSLNVISASLSVTLVPALLHSSLWDDCDLSY